MTHEEIFTNIYTRCYWGSNQDKKYKGSSGQGSALNFNKDTYIPFVRDFIKEKNIQTVVDLGCGDFRCGPTLYDDLDITYHGYDAYKSLIGKHLEEIISPKYNFYHLDFFEKKEEIVSGDLCILKDVLQHWSTSDIYIFLDYLTITKKFKYILITNCSHQHSVKREIKTGDYRPLTCEELPLKQYGAVKQMSWDTKEVSLITVDKSVDI
jgi:hypothetical protein